MAYFLLVFPFLNKKRKLNKKKPSPFLFSCHEVSLDPNHLQPATKIKWRPPSKWKLVSHKNTRYTIFNLRLLCSCTKHQNPATTLLGSKFNFPEEQTTHEMYCSTNTGEFTKSLVSFFAALNSQLQTTINPPNMKYLVTEKVSQAKWEELENQLARNTHKIRLDRHAHPSIPLKFLCSD